MTPSNNNSNPPTKKRVARISATARMYSGPIPPADELIKYEQVCPGAADRIIAMAESQSKHRQRLEDKVIGGNVQNEKMGMWLAFIITVGLILIGTYLIMNDKQVIGFLAIFVPSLFQAGNYAFIKYKEHQHANPKKN
jgi:uncharacterized membrane protein